MCCHYCEGQEIDLVAAKQYAKELDKERDAVSDLIMNKRPKQQAVLLLKEMLLEMKAQSKKISFWIRMDKKYHDSASDKLDGKSG